ncbi:MAG: poly-gamma-glutamate hydrolase family protein [Actinomycetota bacterium]|nr:poly-gamma-glutamate hydrolase family protein [Actinomycetota bacterium]
MGLAGRRRLGTEDEFDGVLDSQVAHPTLSEEDAEDSSEFIERVEDNGRHSGLIAIAPHGGDIEPHTDEQAEHIASRLADQGASSWRCRGWKQGGGAFDRWHITSTDINEASFPGLNSVICRGFAYAVAFHGFDEPEILIGGTAHPSLKEEIRAAIECATAGSGIEVRIAAPDERFGGDDPRNVVNRLTADCAAGIQIEQSLDARERHCLAIADAVADVYALKL